jgi:serine/threonine protein phosphatase PrpC
MSVYHTPAGIPISVGTLSRVGARKQNEDACGFWVTEAGYCFVVSDGAGGHVGGAVASEIAVKAVLGDYAGTPGFSPEAVSRAIALAESNILAGRDGNKELRDMTATIAVLMLDTQARNALYGHLGDTRIYSFRRGRARQLTRDHSLVQNLVDAGYVAPGDLRKHPERSVLLAALGIESEVTASLSERPIDVQEGDAFLICSDGLWEGMGEAEMEDALLRAHSVEEWLVMLESNVARNDKPNQDNYTAVAVWVGSPGDITLVPGVRARA